MSQLDLGEQRKKQLLTEGAQILVRPTSVTREREKREKTLALNDNPTTTTNAMSLTELAERNRGQRGHEVDEPMKIVETDRNRKTDLSIHGAVVNRATLLSQPKRIDKDSRIVNLPLIPSSSQLSDSNLTKTKSLEPPIPDESPIPIDPRFYVCTSFEATISQKTTLVVEEPEGQTEIILPHGSLRSNVALNSIAPSSSASSRSSQYYDYCLSEGEFDVALPSSETNSSNIAKMKRFKETSRIETDSSLNERAFLHVQESLSLTPDDDIMMSPA